MIKSGFLFILFLFSVTAQSAIFGDGNPDNGFVNLSIKVGRGRDLDTRMDIGQTLFEILIDHLQPLFDSRGLAVSFEMRELEEHVKFNKKNI